MAVDLEDEVVFISQATSAHALAGQGPFASRKSTRIPRHARLRLVIIEPSYQIIITPLQTVVLLHDHHTTRFGFFAVAKRCCSVRSVSGSL